MRASLHVLVVSTLLFSMDAAAGEAWGKRQVPVVVRGQAEPAAVEAGKPIPLRITVTNGLPSSIAFYTYSVTPTSWNGETANIALFDILRDGKRRALFLPQPNPHPPRELLIPTMGRRWIEPGKALVIRTDARKWKLPGGWVPGRYRARVRVERLHLDDYSQLWVTSEPFEFEIRAAAARQEK